MFFLHVQKKCGGRVCGRGRLGAGASVGGVSVGGIKAGQYVVIGVLFDDLQEV